MLTKIFTDSECKHGFTLAEVLITLVIVGIVAAMTIPTMVNNTNKEELRTGLLKGQSSLANALQLYYSRTGSKIIPSELEPRTLFDKIKPYFSVAVSCGWQDCVPANKNYYRNFNNSGYMNPVKLDDGQLILNNGMTVFIENPNITISNIYMAIDVNGYEKKPNKLGHDLFFFQLNDEGNLVPMGAEGTDYYSATNEYCSTTSSSQDNGMGCTVKALSDADYFKKLPK